MNFKVIISSLILSMLLLTLTYATVARATPEERRTVYSMDQFLGLTVNVEAPYYADPGENITVAVRAVASSGTDVHYIHINIYALKNETEEIPLADIYLDTPREVDYIITIPNDTSPGLIYGIIRWEWAHSGVTVKPPPAGFVVTYVKNIKLEELQTAYDELNATYQSLLANYTKLKNYKGELGTTRNLMYVFVATTVVAAATAFILLLRRPKRVWS